MNGLFSRTKGLNVRLLTTRLDAIYPIMLINLNYPTALITESEIQSAISAFA